MNYGLRIETHVKPLEGKTVIPAKAGIQAIEWNNTWNQPKRLDSRFRGNDSLRVLQRFQFVIRNSLFVITIYTILVFCYQRAEARRHPRKSSSGRATHQVQKERSQKEDELARLKKEIAGYRAELRQHEKMEQRSRKNLSAYNNRTAVLKATIARLNDKVEQLEEQKSEVDESLQQTANTLDALKQAYANSSRYLYIHGALNPDDADLYPFAPEQQEKRQRMSYYAHAIGEAHAMSRGRLDSMKAHLSISSNQIASTLSAQETKIDEQTSEASALEEKKAEEARQLGQIQQKKESLRKLLAERMASEKRLENIIANLVTKEATASKSTSRKHRIGTSSSRSGRANETEFTNDESSGRTYGPHSLGWPCSSHHVIQGFGEHRNAELNTVTMNLGIDIGAGQGTAVVAAAEGEVSLVSSLPSYGTIIVLKHSGGLHTVYADLNSASVSTGAHVRAGQQLGRVGGNEDSGPLLHFEVWKGKSKQNPMGWLK
jgi:septal ring factor EnvC (AmiA/AmiB activator)